MLLSNTEESAKLELSVPRQQSNTYAQENILLTSIPIFCNLLRKLFFLLILCKLKSVKYYQRTVAPKKFKLSMHKQSQHGYQHLKS